MNIAIIGSRDFPNSSLIIDFVDALPVDTIIVSGGARGVDTISVNRAKERRLSTLVFPADWDKHGKAAGFLRNTTIIENADWVVAFWDGTSRGTSDSIRKAHTSGKPVSVFSPTGHLRHLNGAEVLYGRVK